MAHRRASFFDYFELKEPLERCGFAVVYRCITASNGDELAVKVVDTSKLTALEFQRLEKEAEICRKLNHKNVIKLYASVLEDSYFYMVLELSTGEGLYDEILAKNHYSECDASHYMKQILQATMYCHDHHIIHRNLKPENIMLTSTSWGVCVKLIDFGFALEVHATGARCFFGTVGTPGYLAPEVANREPYGKPVDIWACGVILYILVCGFPPFWGDTVGQLLQNVKRGHYSYPSPNWDDVSHEATDLIDKMMTVNQWTRITAREALQHPWITHEWTTPLTIHLEGTLYSMSKLNARSKLQEAVKNVIMDFQHAAGIFY